MWRSVVILTRAVWVFAVEKRGSDWIGFKREWEERNYQ